MRQIVENVHDQEAISSNRKSGFSPEKDKGNPIDHPRCMNFGFGVVLMFLFLHSIEDSPSRRSVSIVKQIERRGAYEQTQRPQ